MSEKDDYHLGNIEKILDHLSKITNTSMIVLLPSLIYIANRVLSIDNLEEEIFLGKYELSPLIARYVALMFSCLITSILVLQLYFLKSTLSKVSNRFEDAVVTIRQHPWLVNPFSQLVDDGPLILKIFFSILIPLSFFCYLTILQSPILLLSDTEGVITILTFGLLAWLILVFVFSYYCVEEIEKVIRNCKTEDLFALHFSGAIAMFSAWYLFKYISSHGLMH